VCLETVRQSEVPTEPLFYSLSARSSSCNTGFWSYVFFHKLNFASASLQLTKSACETILEQEQQR
jgi:hypothetical protein